jgi:Putative Ig domain/IPT/TIG domain
MSRSICSAPPKARRWGCRFVLAMLFVCLTAGLAESAVVTLGWTASPENDVAGYVLSYGTTSGQLTSTIDVGNTTSYTFLIPDPTRVYYLALRAYNTSGLFSGFSNELSTTPIAPLSVTNLAANASSPQLLGATVTFSATATGGTGPYQYKWWVSAGTTSTMGRDWSTNNTFAWTPPAAGANYTITVWARNASSTIDSFDNPSAKLSLTFAISSAVAATVSSVSPNAGPTGGGTSVTITGTNFVAGATVTLGGTPATDVVVASSTSITARTPARSAGAASVTVTTPGTQGATLTNGYTYTAPAPGGMSLVQHAGTDAGTAATSTLAFSSANLAGNWIGVAIRAGGTGQTFSLSDTRGNVYRKAVQLNETVDGTTIALFYAENIAGGANAVTVSDTLAGNTLRWSIFEYAGVATANSLDGVAASQGSGTTLNSGPAATTASGDLLLGVFSSAVPVTLLPGNGYALQDQVPAAPNTKLMTGAGSATAAGTVSATATASAANNWGAVLAAFKAAGSGASSTPAISNVSPSAGSAARGTIVTISGSNFGATAGASTVTFNGVAAKPTTWSATSIVVPVPGAAVSGNILVTVGGVGSNAALFTVQPTLTSLSPPVAVVGAPVTITGVDFGAMQGTGSVTFNGVPAVPSSWSTSSLVVPVPAGATSGNVVVIVGGVASNALALTVNAPPVLAAIANQTSAENSTVALPLIGGDPDGAAVSYSVTALPAGLALNATTGVISGKLTYSSAGAYVITATVSDGILSTSRSFTWTITDVDRPPVLTAIANQTSLRSAPVSLQLQATDPDGTALTYGASGLPSGLNVNSATGLISGTAASSGTYTVTATASDGSLSTGQTFTWTITAAPIALVQHSRIDAGTALKASLALAAANSAGNLLAVVTRSGAPGETVTVTDSRGNAYRQAARLNNSSDNTLAVYYAENIAAGTNTVTVSNSASATLRFIVLEYSGVASTNSLDGAASASGTSASPNSGILTTTAGGDLLLCALSTANGPSLTGGGGFMVEDAVPALPGAKVVAEDKLQAPAGAASATVTLGASDQWAMAIAAFKAR